MKKCSYCGLKDDNVKYYKDKKKNYHYECYKEVLWNNAINNTVNEYEQDIQIKRNIALYRDEYGY